jgi:hypothetical protein
MRSGTAGSRPGEHQDDAGVLKEVAVGQKVTGDVLFAWSARRGRRPQLTLGWRLRTVAWGRPARWLHSARIDLRRWLEAVDEKENAAAR